MKTDNQRHTPPETGAQPKEDEIMKYGDRILVLNSDIPSHGRNLTSTECRAIRKNGFSCSPTWLVERAFDSAYHGIIYRPCKSGGWDHAGLFVETK